jgi:type VI secretion system secreted protein VgrG
VKVQFHWDRLGKRNEDSSCWVRVAQLWAGTGWGGIHIPRIGQEVIVEFLEGDPDQPIITGRVYNNANMPPYELPGNQTQSGIKSRSTPKGGVNNFNELRFEDKIGVEQVYMQAERDMDTLVKHDQTLEVQNNRKKTVDVDESTRIGRNREEVVDGDESIKISGTRTEVVVKTEAITLQDRRTTDITKSDHLSIGDEYMIKVGKDASLAVTGSHSVTVSKNQSTNVTGDRVHDVKSDTFHVKTKLVIDAGQEIVFKTGAASLTLKSNGEISIRGKSLAVVAADKVSIRATSDVQIKGARNAQN